MPVDLFEKHGITPRKPVDLLPNAVSRELNDNSLLSQITNSAPVNFALGAGDAIRSNLTQLANVLPGVNIPFQPSSKGTAYNIGEVGGDIASFMIGGGALGAARGAAEALPFAGKLAKLLGGQGASGVARRAIGTGAYAAITNPEEREKGALEGAGLSAALDVAFPGLAKAGGKALSAIQPQKHAEKLLKLLGGGQGVEENAKSLAEDIKKSFETKMEKGSDLYNNIFNSVDNSSLYSQVSPELSSYKNLESDIVKNYDRDLTKLHNKFETNPTLKNAHNLQSQLGSSIRKLEASDIKGNLSVADRNVMQAYKEAQKAVRSDVNSFLELENPALAGKYEEATQNWLENVVPYLENPRIASIAKGAKTNPKAISNIFKNPEADILKIAEDLGPEAKNKILYAELGKMAQNINPDKLANEFSKLDQKGLSSYLTPEMEQQFEALFSKIGKRNIAQKGAGLLLGGALAHQLIPGMPIAEMGAALTGMLMSPAAAKGFQRKIPLEKMGEAISGTVKKGYKPSATAAKAIFTPDKKERKLRMSLNLPGEEDF